MNKIEQLYEGKAKKVFSTEDPNVVIVSYKDDATAFDGLKKGTITGKGAINNQMTNYLMQQLEKAGVPCTGINTVDKLFTDPQVAARNMLIEVDQPGMGKVKIAGNPVKMASVEADADHHPAPALGDSTRDILVNMLGWEEAKADEYVEKFH